MPPKNRLPVNGLVRMHRSRLNLRFIVTENPTTLLSLWNEAVLAVLDTSSSVFIGTFAYPLSEKFPPPGSSCALPPKPSQRSATLSKLPAPNGSSGDVVEVGCYTEHCLGVHFASRWLWALWEFRP